jgi:cytochrome c biogenesis protein CcdA
MFLFYFFTYMIIIFFNSAIIACVMIRLEGGDPTIKDGLNASMSMLPLIAAWALIAASVGMLLRMIEERSDGIGQIVSGFLGLAWSAISFLVIPILVVERRGPIASLKESTRLLKRTWGEQLIGRFSFGIVFAILGIPAYLLLFMGFSSITRNSAGGIMLVVLAMIYILILALVQSALQAIFQAVMYKYVRDRKAPTGFNPYMLEGAFSRKKNNFSMGKF